jgi:hypothetical protein
MIDFTNLEYAGRVTSLDQALHFLMAFEGGSMSDSNSATLGIELLVEKCRNEFRRQENTNYYTQDDYKEAERKYVKFCLNGDVDR